VAQIRAAIDLAAERSGRASTSIRLIAVTKGVSLDAIRSAAAAGIVEFGENRVQEALGKMADLDADQAARRSDAVDLPWTWHLIGRLQANKVRAAVGRFALIHSVDSLRLGEAIDAAAAAAAAAGIRQRVLVQVNIGREPQKGGVDPADARGLVEGLMRLSHVQVGGLMAIPPLSADSEAARPHFRALRRLGVSLEAAIPGLAMTEYSMGMSGDFAVAVAEGATMVRVGTAIFGARAQPATVPGG
jgi:hypothetical protein